MTWSDRIKDGAYNSPGGERIEFKYEDLQRTFDKKTSSYDFPDAQGTYIQDMGSTGRKYPILAIFAGADCDTQADAFESALSEVGRGKLEHPIYGTVDVVPFGTVTRSDALKTAANQSTVEVTFWETIPLVYPLPQSDPATDVLDGVRGMAAALGLEIADSLDIFNPSAILGFKARLTAIVSTVKGAISKVKDVISKIDSLIVATLETAQSIKDSIIGVVTSVMDFVASPGDFFNFDSYKSLIDGILSPIFPEDSPSQYLSSKVATETLLGAVLVNVVESKFDTQSAALETAESILEIFEELTDWSETTAEAVGVIDTGESYKRLQNSVALTAGYLVQVSFTLKKERRVVLTRARTIIDLAAELYGEVDEVLDFFMMSNDFSGSEIIEIPKGREVLYYV